MHHVPGQGSVDGVAVGGGWVWKLGEIEKLTLDRVAIREEKSVEKYRKCQSEDAKR